jgi:serine protease AprX
MFKRLLVVTFIVGSTFAFGAPKTAPDVPKSGGNIDVIVQFTHPPTKSDLQLLGPYGQVKKMLDIINAVHISLSPAQIQALSSNPAIAYISPDRTNGGALDITAPTVTANLAWSLGYTGAGVGVAVVDSGIAVKNDLKSADGMFSRVVYSQSFVPGQDATDAYGHGTHVAGIVGGNGKDSSGTLYAHTFKGVAPSVNLISLKVLDQNGAGSDSNVISAIQTAIALKSTYNIRVMNLSLGRPVFESYTLDPLCQAVEAAWKAGIVVVTAAGNSGRDNSLGTHGYGTINAPGNDPYVITVGATNTKGTTSPYDDSVASFSSKGPTMVDHIVKPDIVAPGNGIISLLASTSCTLYTDSNRTRVSMSYETFGLVTGVSNSYLKLSGTSMATPVVSGAAALLIQQNPGLTPDQVKAKLMKSANKTVFPTHMYGTDSISMAQFRMVEDIFTVGAGYLDINAALLSANAPATVSAKSPTVIYDYTTHTAHLSANFSVVFGLDDSVVWGDSIFVRLSNGTTALFAADDSVVWGDSTNMAFSVIWGDAVNLAVPLTATSDDTDDQ